MAQITITTSDYRLEKAIEFYRNHVKQKRINSNSGNAKCAALNTLVKKAILTPSELGDIRNIDLAILNKRMAPHLEHMTVNAPISVEPILLFVIIFVGKQLVNLPLFKVKQSQPRLAN